VEGADRQGEAGGRKNSSKQDQFRLMDDVVFLLFSDHVLLMWLVVPSGGGLLCDMWLCMFFLLVFFSLNFGIPQRCKTYFVVFINKYRPLFGGLPSKKKVKNTAQFGRKTITNDNSEGTLIS
jgi:hypothetical protein